MKMEAEVPILPCEDQRLQTAVTSGHEVAM